MNKLVVISRSKNDSTSLSIVGERKGDDDLFFKNTNTNNPRNSDEITKRKQLTIVVYLFPSSTY